MTTYEKEKRKIIILLGVGAFLTVVFLGNTIRKYGFDETLESFSELSGWFIVAAITCYPLGLVYGWRRMLGLALSTSYREPATRYYTVQERIGYKSGRMMAYIIKLALVVCFGWIFGTISAFKQLIYLKKTVN